MTALLSHHASARDAERGSRRARRAQSGETLIEVLVAVVLMGVAFTAVLGGMIGSSRVARQNQELSRANVVLSAAAERLLEPTGAFRYKPCAAANNGIDFLNNGDIQWQMPWGLVGGYTPIEEKPLLPTGWRVRIKDVRYLLGPDYHTPPNGASFAPNEDNVLEPEWSPWGLNGFLKCYDLNGMWNSTDGLQRDGGLQQIKVVVEKPDGTGPQSYQAVDEIIVTKRDQRCPETNFNNADRGPC